MKVWGRHVGFQRRIESDLLPRRAGCHFPSFVCAGVWGRRRSEVEMRRRVVVLVPVSRSRGGVVKEGLREARVSMSWLNGRTSGWRCQGSKSSARSLGADTRFWQVVGRRSAGTFVSVVAGDRGSMTRNTIRILIHPKLFRKKSLGRSGVMNK